MRRNLCVFLGLWMSSMAQAQIGVPDTPAG